MTPIENNNTQTSISQKESEETNITYSNILYQLIKEPPKVAEYSFLEELLTAEDYIIFFYIQQSNVRGLKFNRKMLDLYMQANSQTWLAKNSKLVKRNKINEDSIKSQTDMHIGSKNDLAQALHQLTLRRYDEIIDENKDNPTEIDPESLNQFASTNLTRNLLTDTVTLLREGIYDPETKNTYQPGDVLQYLTTKVATINNTMSSLAGSNLSYQTDIENTFASTALSYNSAFEWNLGGGIHLPKINKGYMVSLLGQEKVGKTKFAIGEMAYNTMRKGGNVLLYSAEISKEVLIANMVAKHIHVEDGLEINIDNILSQLRFHYWEMKHNITYEKVLQERTRLQSNPDSEPLIPGPIYAKLASNLKEYLSYLKMPKDIKETIMRRYDEIILSGRYGRLYVKSLEEGVFDVDTIVEKSTKFNQENDIEILIIDHAGFTTSSKSRDKFDAITSMYQAGKTIATFSEHPTAVIVVNHTDGDSNAAIKKGKVDPSSMRAYGTREANKSADLELVIYATPEELREGTVNLFVTVSRNEPPPDDPIVLLANRKTNTYQGIKAQKSAYPQR